jgi:hypothetical protein
MVPMELREFLFDKSLHKAHDNLITKKMQRKQERNIKHERVNMVRKKGNKRKEKEEKQSKRKR